MKELPQQILAVFIDFENLALGFKDRSGRFDANRVLARLVEKGNIVVKRAYADWKRFSDYTTGLHEAGIELIEITARRLTGKNSADMRLCVDAMDMSYSKAHIDTFVIVSGDSDFSPLVSKLKENGKHVIGLGMKESSSHLLIDNCDEFIYYEDLERPSGTPPAIEQDLPEQKKEAFQLLSLKGELEDLVEAEGRFRVAGGVIGRQVERDFIETPGILADQLQQLDHFPAKELFG